jgi:hypothetical protein
MTVEFPREATDPRFMRFFQYWQSRAPPGKLPGRRHFDPPFEIPDLLPSIVLYEVVRSGERLRFKFRLVGTLVVEMAGFEPTGKYADEIHLAPRRHSIQAALEGVVRNKQAHYWQVPIAFAGREYIAYQRLALPLAADGETVDMIFGLQLPVSKSLE